MTRTRTGNTLINGWVLVRSKLSPAWFASATTRVPSGLVGQWASVKPPPSARSGPFTLDSTTIRPLDLEGERVGFSRFGTTEADAPWPGIRPSRRLTTCFPPLFSRRMVGLASPGFGLGWAWMLALVGLVGRASTFARRAVAGISRPAVGTIRSGMGRPTFRFPSDRSAPLRDRRPVARAGPPGNGPRIGPDSGRSEPGESVRACHHAGARRQRRPRGSPAFRPPSGAIYR